MSSAMKMAPRRMTVAEFLDWNSGDGTGALWQLHDGEPEMMAPASDPRGSIQARLTQLPGVYLHARDGASRLVIAPGVIAPGVVPAHGSEDNCLVPDIGVTCAPPTRERLMHQPLVLIEIPSPTNVSRTRANVLAYRTIASVAEIVVVHSTAVGAEVSRRGAGGSWPRQPEMVDADGVLRLDSIGFAAPLREAYRTGGLL